MDSENAYKTIVRLADEVIRGQNVSPMVSQEKLEPLKVAAIDCQPSDDADLVDEEMKKLSLKGEWSCDYQGRRYQLDFLGLLEATGNGQLKLNGNTYKF